MLYPSLALKDQAKGVLFRGFQKGKLGTILNLGSNWALGALQAVSVHHKAAVGDFPPLLSMSFALRSRIH